MLRLFIIVLHRDKIQKEVLFMAKLVAEGTPDVLICGKRAYEYDYGPLPN